MYLKLILCYVKEKDKLEFQKRQAVWKEVEKQPGLLFQIGGWDNLNPLVSCKLALWENKELYQHFHRHGHDEIVEKADHKHLYYKIEIDFFQSVLPMEGSASTLQEAVSKTKVLRIANCLVFPNQKDAFINAQKNIWIPNMKISPGMLGGYYSVNCADDNRFVVSTFWESQKEHDEYRQSKVKDLAERAKIKETIKEIHSHFVTIVPEWSAIGEASKQILF